MAAAGDRFMSLQARALELEGHGDIRGAVKVMVKAAELYPGQFLGHYNLGRAHHAAGKTTEAVSHLLKAMDVSKPAGGSNWSMAATHAFMCFCQPSCTAPEPEWMTDIQQLRLLAERAIYMISKDQVNYYFALQMRASAFEGQVDPSAKDLRQALHDRTTVMNWYRDDNPNKAIAVQFVENTKKKLRARISADVAAIRAGAGATASQDTAAYRIGTPYLDMPD